MFCALTHPPHPIDPPPGSRVPSLGRSTSIGTSACCFPGSPWRWTVVLPMSFSLSQSPPSILHSRHAAETPATSSTGGLSGTSKPAIDSHPLGEGFKSEQTRRQTSTRLTDHCPKSSVSSLLSPRTDAEAAEMLGDWSEVEACPLSWVRSCWLMKPYCTWWVIISLQRLAGEETQQWLFTLKLFEQSSGNIAMSIKLRR